MMDRIPPHDLDAERSLISSLINGALAQANGEARPDDLYSSGHADILRAMLHLRDHREPGMDFGGSPGEDVQCIAWELQRRGRLDEVGGIEALHEIAEAEGHPYHWKYYLGIVREHADRRRMIYAATDTLRELYEDPRANLGEVRERFVAATEGKDYAAHGPVTFAELAAANPHQAEPIVDGLLRRGEVGSIVSASKIGKSWLLYSLLLAVATGRRWLDRFACRTGRVALIDNELSPALIAYRLREVAAAMSIREADFSDRIEVVSLRGRLRDIHGLQPIIRGFGRRFDLIALDALYRALPEGTKEIDNAGMKDVANRIAQYAADADAAWCDVHHSSKGDQSGKEIVDVGSGAAALARAADLHLVLRRHDEEGAVVLETALRSFAPTEPMALRWNFPLWQPAPDLDPAKLKRSTPAQERKLAEDRDGKRLILDAIRAQPASIRALKTRTGIGYSRAERLIGLLVQDGLVRGENTTGKGGDCVVYHPN